MTASGALSWYYLATPAFLLLDVLWGVSIRVTALDDAPGLKYLYYAVCLGFGVVTRVRPGLSGIVGLAESSLNIVLLVVGMLLPYFRLLQALAEGQDVATNPYTATVFVNFFLSGAVWVAAFYGYETALSGGRRRRWRP